MAEDKRPNILYIMTDQQCADAISCAGNKDIKTPAIDSIAENGIRFEKAYCTQPLCVPSRVSKFTGRMPHETGVTFNMNRLQLYCPMIGKMLSDAGYDCGYVGKWHVTISPEEKDLHGFESCYSTNPKDQKACFGFDLSEENTKKEPDFNIAPACIDFTNRKRNKPFFLVASFNNPHDICQWARGDRHPNGRIDDAPGADECPQLPDNFEIPDFEPQIIRQHQKQAPFFYPVVNWRDRKWRQYRWAYYRLVELIDSRIGLILEALRKSGRQDNTLVIFSSDHGDGNAAHKWNQKMLLYDETTRIPLIASLKGVTHAGSVDSDHLVSNGLDLMPTLCDYAGIEPPAGLEGKSIRPLIEGRNPDNWRKFVVSETDLHHKYGEPDHNCGRMLRTSGYKYIVYSKGSLREQLFDMEKDPGEMNNLAVNPDYKDTLQRHRRLLAGWCKQTNDFFIVPDMPVNSWTLTDRNQSV